MDETEKTEAELLSSIMANSEFVPEEAVPEPPEPEEVEEDVEDDAEELEEDLEEVEEEEGDEEDDVEEDEELEEEPDEEPEDDGVQYLEEDEVDWTAEVPVKIDGELQFVSLEELRKGYATDQHLSAKGREIGEAQKEIDAYREQRLSEIEGMAQALNGMMGASEQNLSQQYHALDAQIEEARGQGDTYRVQELKDQREVVQQQYWSVRNQREGALQQVAEARQQVETEQWNQQVQAFYDGIQEVIPGYDEDYANALREFGESEGISQEYMQSIVDPTIVKVLDDYRQLKQGVSEGAKKRVRAPVKKTPKKKTRTADQKKASRENMTKARAFREDASEEDQMNFLRQRAAQTLGLD